MKRCVSLILCLTVLVSLFSSMGVTAMAADAKKLFTVKQKLSGDKLTYTIYLKKNKTLSGSIIHIKFDPSVLNIVESEHNNAYMVDDGDGGSRENISGIYESGFVQVAGPTGEFVRSADTYSIAHVYSQDVDYKASSSDKAYMKLQFKVVNKERPETSVKMYCYEYNSISSGKIPNGSQEYFYNKKVKTLGQTAYKDIISTKDGVVITWKKTTGADQYEILRKTTGEYKSLYTTADASVTSYEDKNVSNNVKYTYIVRGKNEAGKNYKDATVSTRYTIAPSKLKLSNGDGKVAVSWSEVDGATAYRVYRRNVNADGTRTEWKYISDKITKLKYSDSTVSSGTTYEYAVRVYSDGGYSDLYSEKAILYIGVPDFTVATDVKGVKITWDKVPGATKYRIYRKLKGGSWKRIKSVTEDSASYSYIDTEAISGKKNYYKIKALNESYTSDDESKSLNYLKTPKASLKNSTSGVKISWEKSDGATSYYIYRKVGSAKSWKKIAETKKTYYTDKKVESGKTYKYCVRAVNDSYKSKYGSSTYAKIVFLSAPKLASIQSEENGVTVAWSKVKGATGYLVYRKEESGKYKKLAEVSGKDNVKYVDESAAQGVTYSYRVYATYKTYKSAYKSSLSVKDSY